ncbi:MULTISPECIES: phosphoenolpyruvate synthase [unclassified Imperialibacter]|uniref:phosphoenolpyruvate synthase n=1 Tax=unclassified Imperialibacter TaxID=2629706 RepID=UPI00125EC08E|nr:MULTISPECIES: phosphoenolpyruvate synthase [unclassified Imperialibacter]CAD5265231.1 Phosphoenolpyruvate synthase [Imperialibacter sp. 89]
MKNFILPFQRISMADLAKVGGKNASLGEMISQLAEQGISVPDGFAITVAGWNEFLHANQLTSKLQALCESVDVKTLDNLPDVGSKCRSLVAGATLPGELQASISKAYQALAATHGGNLSVAVRSSATAEDSPTASFAGQHESFLNVHSEGDLLEAVKKCYRSLFNDRAIKYRIDNGFDHMQVGLSVGVQVMVRSDKSSAGVAFTIEPESGNKNLIYVTGAWGLGESVVQGAVNTDEFYLFKPAIEKGMDSIVFRRMGGKQQMMVYGTKGDNTIWKETPQRLRDQYVLSDEEVTQLGKWCHAIEKHYKLPMDIEWAKDGLNDQLYIIQARPETIHGQNKQIELKEYSIKAAEEPLLMGKAVGHSVVSGRACVVRSLADAGKVQEGDILVADITNPDWNALLRKAVCIVTNKGGRTSHASIIARELGIPAVVGTLLATEKLSDGQTITVSCAGGDVGKVYDGKLDWQEKVIPMEKIKETKTKRMLILADPEKALLYASYPNDGVGLLRMEFIISNTLQVHPMALVKFDELPSSAEKKQIEAVTRHYTDKKKFFVEQLAESIGMVAAAFYPREVIVRMSDFKTNEYAKLLGGRQFEPDEENPMLGFRGASRYYNERYREGFGLECQAIKKVRDQMGLTNVRVMIPFCRTVEEGKQVLEVMREFGLESSKNGLEVYVMAEIPSNILLADQFADLFDGFSIGSNDLTQLTLGIDRDSAIISDLFNERNEAVTFLIRQLIVAAHRKGVKVGLCGQAPSDYPDFARFLVSSGIDSISFNPDALIKGIENIMVAEREIPLVQADL